MIKSIKFFAATFLGLFLLVVTAISCTKTTSVDDSGQTGGTFIKFKQNNISYNLSNPIITELTNTKIDAFQGADANLVGITLYMPLDASVGTHFMTDSPSDDETYGAYYVQGNSIDMLANAGIITITSITETTIAGTFSFSGLNGSATVEITNGSFIADR